MEQGNEQHNDLTADETGKTIETVDTLATPAPEAVAAEAHAETSNNSNGSNGANGTSARTAEEDVVPVNVTAGQEASGTSTAAETVMRTAATTTPIISPDTTATTASAATPAPEAPAASATVNTAADTVTDATPQFPTARATSDSTTVRLPKPDDAAPIEPQDIFVSAQPTVPLESPQQEPQEPQEPLQMPQAQQPSDTEATTPPAPKMPLVAGDMVGSFLIERVLRVTPDETSYLAIGIQEDGERGPYVTLIERAQGGFSENVLRFIALRLRHPRLLAPRALLPQENGRDFLVVETLVDEHGEPAQLVSEGGRLPVINTLTGGAGLADALSYLHRNGVAHLHVSPDTILTYNGRAYLMGLEQASYLDMSSAEGTQLIARDTNFLARTLLVIGGISAEEVPDEDLVDDNLRRIAAHGATDGFESPGELAGACSVALESVAHALPNLTTETARIMLEIGSATTVGRVRSQNQDACAWATFELSDDWTQGEPVGIFLVADGMGGEARGELASRIAARMVLAEMTSHFTLPTITRPALEYDETQSTTATGSAAPAEQAESDLTKTLVQAVDRANQQVRALAQQLGKVTGTTMTAIAVQGQRAALAHLGDSRAYLLRGDVMVKLTEDHSVLARLQALDHPLLSDPEMFIPRNTLYRSLGQEEDTIPDTLEFMVAPGDRLLICSDGLWDDLDSQALGQTLAGTNDPRACTEQLVQMANAAGGSDNSTALAIFVHAVPEDAERLALANAWAPPSAAN